MCVFRALTPGSKPAMGRMSKMAKGAAKRGASAAGRGTARFAKRAVREGYETATVEKCPQCGTRSKATARVCPSCGREKH